MKKLRLVSLVGITSIILAQGEWAAAQGLGAGGSGSGGIGGGNLSGLQSSTENQIKTTQAQSARPGKQDTQFARGPANDGEQDTGQTSGRKEKRRESFFYTAPAITRV